jgi:hypothetical protein
MIRTEAVLLVVPVMAWIAQAIVALPLIVFAQTPDLAGPSAIMTALANLGGLGLLAMVLWRLHDQARQDAREDRAAERKLWSEHLIEFRHEASAREERACERHEELLGAIREPRRTS